MNKESADRWFKNHVATLNDYGTLKVLDFKNPESNNYRIRFIFEEDHYKLHISGDFGHLTATNYKNMTYDGFYQFVNNPGYFMEKVECHDRPFFTYELEKARKDIRTFIKEHDLIDECVDDYCNWDDLKGAALNNAAISEIIEEILEDFDFSSGVGNKGWQKLEEMYSDAFEYISDFGKKDTDIVEVYLYAFKLAQSQLESRT